MNFGGSRKPRPTLAAPGAISWTLVMLLVIAALATVPATPAQAAAPVARWVADDWAGGTANWVDRVGGKIATVASAANSPAKVAGAIAGSTNSGLVFDGVNDYFKVAVGENPVHGATSMTVAAFFKTSQAAPDNPIWWARPGPINGEASGFGNDWGLTYDAAGGASAFFGWQLPVSPAVPLTDGQPHTMIMTWQTPEKIARLYIDGALAGSLATSESGGIDNSSGLAFGANNEGGGSAPDRFFSGTIGELRLYTTIQDPAAVHSELVTAPARPPSPTIYYPLTVTKDGDGSGDVGGEPQLQIDCGTNCSSALASHTYGALTATADEGSEFAGWSGGCLYVESNRCTVHVTGPQTITATFRAIAPQPPPDPEPSPSISPDPQPQSESFAVAVTLRLLRRDGSLVARGKVVSEEPSCLAMVPVEIHRVRENTLSLKGTATTGPNGKYRAELGARKGTYVATVPVHDPTDLIECLGAESEIRSKS